MSLVVVKVDGEPVGWANVTKDNGRNKIYKVLLHADHTLCERISIEVVDYDPTKASAPTEPGFYKYEGGYLKHTNRILRLDDNGNWWVWPHQHRIDDNNQPQQVTWDYIETQLGNRKLVML